MPVVSTAKMNARQFLLLGDDPPGVRLELVNGEVAVSPSPRPRHSFPAQELARLIGNHIKQFDLGMLLPDTDTIFGEFDVRRPDLAYFMKARQHLIEEDEAVDVSPDLCVEVVSPSSVTVDRNDKFEQYAAGKVAHYWILDPQVRTIDAFRLKGKKYVPVGRGEGSDIVRLPPFPNLDIPLADLWFPKPPKRK
jgi:Uma2 family endonuclease